MTSERINSIINSIKSTTAYKLGSVDYITHNDKIVVYSTIDDNFKAIKVIYALDPYAFEIKAWKSKVYLEIK